MASFESSRTRLEAFSRVHVGRTWNDLSAGKRPWNSSGGAAFKGVITGRFGPNADLLFPSRRSRQSTSSSRSSGRPGRTPTSGTESRRSARTSGCPCPAAPDLRASGGDPLRAVGGELVVLDVEQEPDDGRGGPDHEGADEERVRCALGEGGLADEFVEALRDVGRGGAP